MAGQRGNLADECAPCFGMCMDPDFSNGAVHKLQAMLNYGLEDPDRHFPESYIEACRRWFAALSNRQRQVGEFAVAAFAKGNKLQAEAIAAALPPAPKCPLI